MKSHQLRTLAQLALFASIFTMTSCAEETPKDNATDSATEVVAVAETGSKVLDSVASVLVDAKGESVDAAELAESPYLLVYYSAHWCPPCRLFTPKLVEFYNANGGGEKFDLVFVSSDRSEEAMFGYMEEEHMPWAAVSYDAIGDSGLKSYGGPYIPSLVMFDAKGNTILATDYDAEVEPDKVLEKLKSML